MGPWKVLEGYGVEASMASSSLATASSLHRALFIEYNDEVRFTRLPSAWLWQLR